MKVFVEFVLRLIFVDLKLSQNPYMPTTNCNLLNSSDTASQALVNFCTSFNLSQLIRQPTRVTESSATLIDVILTSHENLIIDAKVMPSSISDHDLIYAVLKLKRQRPKPVYITTRSFKNYQQNAFLRDISMVLWCIIDYFDDIDDSLYAFNTLFNEVQDKHAPIRKVRIRGRLSPYITDEIRELMKSRDRRRKIARKTRNPDAWAAYKNLRNDVKREIRSAERAFAADQITSNPNNSSQLCKTIRSFIPKKSASVRSFSKDDRTVANDFNRFFTSVGQVAVDKINYLANECNFDLSTPTFDPRIFPVTDQFNFKHIDCDEVAQIVSSMPANKSSGINKMLVRVIKDSLPATLPVITFLINASFTRGNFLRSWKLAVMSPILKDGNHEEPNNNRPISLLPILSKVCERVALNQIMPYLVSKKGYLLGKVVIRNSTLRKPP